MIKQTSFACALFFCMFIVGACTQDASQDTENKSVGNVEGGKDSEIVKGGEGAISGQDSDAKSPFWGNRDQIKKIMSTISGATPDLTVSNESGSTLNWRGGRFDGLPVDQWGFNFYRGQMLYAQLHYTTEMTKLSPDHLYDSLSSAMNGRYGQMMMDSKNLSSKALLGYTNEELEFISRVGSSLAGSEFRMWTSGDSTAHFVATIYRAPRAGLSEVKDVYVTWYDRLQAEAYDQMIQSYSK